MHPMTSRGAFAAFAAACTTMFAAPAFAQTPSPAPVASPAASNDAALIAALQRDLTAYIKAHEADEHVSASSVYVSFKDGTSVEAAGGTTTFGGSTPLANDSLWQIGSNTKAFTAATILQLEAEGKLSIHDTLGKWLPQYPAWHAITIERLLNMTSGIPTYDDAAPFMKATAANPKSVIPATRLISFSIGKPLQHGYNYTNTAYLLSQLIIEKVTHDTYGDQLRKRFFEPLGLTDASFHTDFNPPEVNARMPAGYFYAKAVKPMARLVGTDVRPYTTSWMQAAGGIVASMHDLTTWARALYEGRVLKPAQQAELENVVSTRTGKTIGTVNSADPRGFGLGVLVADAPAFGGKLWSYEGGTFGFRTFHAYVPGSKAVIAVGLNSGADSDAIGALFTSIYATLHAAGKV